MQAAIYGVSGLRLAAAERDFFRQADPAGYILFSRNCADRVQLRRLTDSLRELSGRDQLAILIDQEGGRVARLGPPQWPVFPAAAEFARLYERAPVSAIEAARANAQAIAAVLGTVGVNVACLPVLDLRHPRAHGVVGDRSFGSDPMQVASLGRAVLDGLASGGVIGVIKHMPGHGRATVDSHHALPVVEASEAELEVDVAPFASLADAPIAMTAHVLYCAWDRDRVATMSPKVISQVVRGRIGFGGLLLSDDIGMNALSGSLSDRARDALAAGCDLVVHGSGRLPEAEAVAQGVGPLGAVGAPRLDRALATARGPGSAQSLEMLLAKRDLLLDLA